jgi:geranylgeranyl pyrophosphate synthase
MLAGADRSGGSLRRLRPALGTAFQLIDDLLDYEGDAGEMGKNVGDDLREGKPTLPLLLAMQRGTAEQSASDPRAIETARSAPGPIIAIVRRHRRAGCHARGGSRGRSPTLRD